MITQGLSDCPADAPLGVRLVPAFSPDSKAEAAAAMGAASAGEDAAGSGAPLAGAMRRRRRIVSITPTPAAAAASRMINIGQGAPAPRAGSLLTAADGVAVTLRACDVFAGRLRLAVAARTRFCLEPAPAWNCEVSGIPAADCPGTKAEVTHVVHAL